MHTNIYNGHSVKSDGCFISTDKFICDKCMAKNGVIIEKYLRRYDQEMKYLLHCNICQRNGLITHPDIIKEIQEMKINIYGETKDEKKINLPINIDEEKQILLEGFKMDDNYKKIYSKSKSTGPERSILTIFAEQNGWASYTDDDTNGNFVITKSKNELINNVESFDEQQINKFNNIYSLSLTKSDWIEGLKLHNLYHEANLFMDELKKYGLAGIKRRDNILCKYIIELISSHPKYKELHDSKVSLVGSLDKSFTISKNLYNANNHNKLFISLDITSAIFLAYHKIGIITEPTWELFLRNHCTNSHSFISNKKMRLMIFGKLDKSKQHNVLIPNQIIPIWEQIKGIIDEKNKLAMEGDELILYTNEDNCMKDVNKLCDLKLPSYVKLVCFKLIDLCPNEKNKYYARQFIYPKDKVYDIKCAGQHNLFAAHKKYLSIISLT